MKTFIVIALLFVVGCIPTVQQVQTATNKTDTLMVVVDKMQEAFEVLVKDGVIKSEKLEALSDEIDEAQERLVIVNEAIKEKADESALDQIRAGWEETKDFNPYYAYGALALTILGETGLFSGLLLKTNKKNRGLEKGINRVKGEAEPEQAKRIHDTMKLYT